MDKQTGRLSGINIVVIYLFILFAGGWVSYSVYKTGDSISDLNTDLTSRQLPSLNHISQLSYWINEYERILYEFYATNDRVAIERQLSAAHEKIKENIVRLDKTFNKNVDIEAISQIFDKMQKHSKILDQTLPPEPYDWDAARVQLVIITDYGLKTLPFLNNLTALIEQQVEDSKLESKAKLSQMSIWVFVFSSLILLISLFVGYYVRKMLLQAVEKQKLAMFIEKNPNPVACMDYKGGLEFENTAWRSGYPENEYQPLKMQILSQIEVLKSKPDNFMTVKLKLKEQFVEVSLHNIESLNQLMVFVENITEKEVARQELEYLAYHDPLTGLPNRKKLEADLRKRIGVSIDGHFCILTVEFQRLKQITSVHGHSVSDALMRIAVIRMRELLQEHQYDYSSSQLYRFGGAKFDILVLDDEGAEKLKQKVTRLFDIFRNAFQQSLNTKFGRFFINIQAGCALFPEHGNSYQTILQNSNAALVDANNKNPEKVNIFNRELADQAQNWFRLENDMRQSEFSESFFLVYQPKFELLSGKLSGMEALVRWQHPKIGLVSPVEFVPIAEESGLILALGDWILDTAVKQAKTWSEAGNQDIQMAVNVSPSQLLSINFCQRVFDCLKTHQLAPQLLEIEVTEEVMVEDKTLCIEVLDELKNSGVSIAIDDFGTGYSSLSYLNRLPLSKVKIDRAFVTDIHQNRGNLAIVRSILALCKSMNFQVIAEGIESQEEVEMLKQLGCQQGQGYLFSKPLINKELEQQFLSKTSNSS